MMAFILMVQMLSGGEIKAERRWKEARVDIPAPRALIYLPVDISKYAI